MRLSLLKHLDRKGLNTVWGKLEEARTCGDSQAAAPAGGGGLTGKKVMTGKKLPEQAI